MGINTITFNGINSLNVGLYVSGDKTFNSPEKDYERVSIPGRSGDLLRFNNRYKNVDVIYDGIVINNYETNTSAIRDWLMSAPGYCRLEDTYHTDEFRIAYFQGPIEFDTLMLQAGSTSLTFNCKPQRFLKSGETAITKTASGTISNPTSYDSMPLIRIYGSGTFSVGNIDVTVNTPGTNFIDLDTEIWDAYEGASNRNSNIRITNDGTMVPGNNIITIGTGITKLEITPRWWRL